MEDKYSVLDVALTEAKKWVCEFEAMTPGEFKKQGAGLEIFYGFCDSPFGDCLLAQKMLR